MSNLVYVETTIFSFYHDDRKSPEVVARREWTRRWWDQKSTGYELVTAAPVLAELNAGALPHKHAARTMAEEIRLLPFEEGLTDIVAFYIQQKLMEVVPLSVESRGGELRRTHVKPSRT